MRPNTSENCSAHFYCAPSPALTYPEPTDQRHQVDSGSDEIYFVVPTKMRDQESTQDVCLIGYWVMDNDGNDKTPGVLMRYCLSDKYGTDIWKTFDPLEEVESEVLGLNVRSLTFDFWSNATSSWENAAHRWDSANSSNQFQYLQLPAAIRITLVVQDPTNAEHDRTFVSIVWLRDL